METCAILHTSLDCSLEFEILDIVNILLLIDLRLDGRGRLPPAHDLEAERVAPGTRTVRYNEDPVADLRRVQCRGQGDGYRCGADVPDALRHAARAEGGVRESKLAAGAG